MEKELIDSVSQTSFWSQLTISLGVLGLMAKGIKYIITAEVKVAMEKAIKTIRTDIAAADAATNLKIDKLIEIILKK